MKCDRTQVNRKKWNIMENIECNLANDIVYLISQGFYNCLCTTVAGDIPI